MTNMATSGTKRKRIDLSELDQMTPFKEITNPFNVSHPQVFHAKDQIRIQFQVEQIKYQESKRRRIAGSCKAPDVHVALLEWYHEARLNNIPITGPILIYKAKQLATRLNPSGFTPSYGWLDKWGIRNGIWLKRKKPMKASSLKQTPKGDTIITDRSSIQAPTVEGASSISTTVERNGIKDKSSIATPTEINGIKDKSPIPTATEITGIKDKASVLTPTQSTCNNIKDKSSIPTPTQITGIKDKSPMPTAREISRIKDKVFVLTPTQSTCNGIKDKSSIPTSTEINDIKNKSSTHSSAESNGIKDMPSTESIGIEDRSAILTPSKENSIKGKSAIQTPSKSNTIENNLAIPTSSTRNGIKDKSSALTPFMSNSLLTHSKSNVIEDSLAMPTPSKSNGIKDKSSAPTPSKSNSTKDRSYNIKKKSSILKPTPKHGTRDIRSFLTHTKPSRANETHIVAPELNLTFAKPCVIKDKQINLYPTENRGTDETRSTLTPNGINSSTAIPVNFKACSIKQEPVDSTDCNTNIPKETLPITNFIPIKLEPHIILTRNEKMLSTSNSVNLNACNIKQEPIESTVCNTDVVNETIPKMNFRPIKLEPVELKLTRPPQVLENITKIRIKQEPKDSKFATTEETRRRSTSMTQVSTAGSGVNYPEKFVSTSAKHFSTTGRHISTPIKQTHSSDSTLTPSNEFQKQTVTDAEARKAVTLLRKYCGQRNISAISDIEKRGDVIYDKIKRQTSIVDFAVKLGMC